MTTAALRELLSGGDRRSIAQAGEALRRIEREPALVGDLTRLTADADWLVSMRALDLLEKLAHSHPDRVEPHRQVFIGPLADSDKWEIHLQIVRALPLFRWTDREMPRVLEILRRDVGHRQKFVRAWAADSLSLFALADPSLLPVVMEAVDAFERSGSKALATRARVIRQRLEAAAT